MNSIRGKGNKFTFHEAEMYANDLPELRDYVRRKYDVNLEEDLVVMIEDLIKRERQMTGEMKARQ